MTQNKLLLSLSEKLNVDPRSLTKAEEYFRVIHDKATGRYVDDCTKAILALDLAATNSGLPFDRDKSLKLSGLKKQTYKTYLKLYEKLLNLNKLLNISEVCVQLGCSEAKDLAQQILLKYEENNITDRSNPMYISAAISAACKIKHVKVAKSKFLEVSQLKATQWKGLEAKFQGCAESFSVSNKRSAQTDVCTERVDVEKESQGLAIQNVHVKEECQDEDYEIWKANILSKARAALQKENANT